MSSLEANTRTFIRKMEIITFYSSNSEEHANNKKNTHTHTKRKNKSSCTVKYLWRNHGKIHTMFLHRSDPIFQSNA